MSYTAHVDTFARDHLPPPDQWPELIFTRPEVQYPDRLNCAAVLLDDAVARGWGERVAMLGADGALTYAQLLARVNQAANYLTNDLGLIPGNRVLLRGANSPLFAVLWLAAAKAGLVVVATMALLRERELVEVITKAEIGAALCDRRLDAELLAAQARCPVLRQIAYWNDPAGLEARLDAQPATFAAVPTAADDTVLIAFTSGSTGKPKATMHFHRDILAIGDLFPRSVLGIRPDDVCIGTPPLPFTFGLGGLLLFPLRVGAATVLLERASPAEMLAAVDRFGATIVWSSPVFFRQMAPLAAGRSFPTLRASVSAGETLPVSTRTLWRDATGIDIVDGIGATEMLHIFISAAGDAIRPGATGTAVPGYMASVLDDAGQPLPPGQVGRLAVKGPTGCRYLADERQRSYVQGGWNLTGDAYLQDADGYFWFQARTDDIILTAGYNVAGPEVENALLEHPAVAECAVVGAPDDDRGQIIKAYVVLRPGFAGDATLAAELQEHVKRTIAPYKYPRAIEFCDKLPRADTGKLQRFKLRSPAPIPDDAPESR